MDKTTKKKIGKVLSLAGVLFGLWFVWYSYGLYEEKGQSENEAWTVADSQPATDAPGAGTMEYGGKSYERDPSIKAYLFLGVDTSGELEEKVAGSGGQADAIILAAYNTAKDSMRALMIPRDTMTEITMTDLSGKVLGKGVQHINLAYAYGDGKALSCERMSEAVSELLGGLKIDGYLAMNTSMIGEMNDLAGGVTVTVETEGLETRDPELAKGNTVTLKGKQAETFVRYRDIEIDNSALIRLSQQKQYLEAYLEAVRKQAAKDDQTIVRIVEAAESQMITNLGKPQYMEMAGAVISGNQKLTGEDILTLPGEAVTTMLYDEYHPKKEEIPEMVLELFYREK